MADFSLVSKDLETEKPTDRVIAKIKELIGAGELKPGDRLPAERKLAVELGVGRTQVREALHKLEFYGIIKTLPQSGSVINGLDITTLDGLISDVLNLQHYDFLSLVETRILLEIKSIELCAERRTDKDIEKLEKALSDYIKYFNTPDRISYDFAFHRAMAEASHNPVFKAMLMIVIPDIMTIYLKDRICAPNEVVSEEHRLMLDCIKNRDSAGAGKLMAQHLQGVLDFAKAQI
ncbi:MAG: FadR/GntR family transcriptional regulator [Bacteroidales bacterium]